jgi:hypothetical protein
MISDAGGHRAQAIISSLMPVVVIKLLEIVQIQEQQRHLTALTETSPPLKVKILVERSAVRQPSQAVLQRQHT